MMHRWQVRAETLAEKQGGAQHMRGVSLIELMITLAIGAIILTVGVPAFQTTVVNARVAAHTNDYISSLNLARSEAVKRGRRVLLCKSSDGASCITSGGWEQGWIVFLDMDNNAAVDTGSGDVILRVYGPLEGGETLQGDTHVSDYIAYSSDGFTRLVSGDFQSGTLTFGLCSNNYYNIINISNTGHARVVKVACP